MDSPPMFNSVEDECRYWKERAKLYHKEWTDVKQEYDEYVEQSRQVEAEMDATLDQKQSIIKDLRTKLAHLEKENESLKFKRDSDAIEFANLTKQLENVKHERDSMKDYMRQLEQKNDDLERAHRILNESIVDFERMLDKAYEKNALLELEVDEKEILQEKLQRLMDETRDLKQELNVKARYVPNGSANNTLTNSTTVSNGTVALERNGDALLNSLHSTATTASNTTTTGTNKNDYNHLSIKNPDNLLNGNAMQASSKTNALNIVADMLRKLNLDKALICHHCDKFRCICARPATEMNHNRHNAERSVRRLSRNFATPSFDSYASTAPVTDDSLQLGASAAVHAALCPGSGNGSSNQLNFGTNMFKRFAQRMSGNADSCAAPTTVRNSLEARDAP